MALASGPGLGIPFTDTLLPRQVPRLLHGGGEAWGAAGAAVPSEGHTKQGQQQKGPSAKRGTPHAEGVFTAWGVLSVEGVPQLPGGPHLLRGGPSL